MSKARHSRSGGVSAWWSDNWRAITKAVSFQLDGFGKVKEVMGSEILASDAGWLGVHLAILGVVQFWRRVWTKVSAAAESHQPSVLIS